MERLYIYTMKRFLFVAACLLMAAFADAQKPALGLNEHNVYIYYEVVNTPGITVDSLKKNAAGFMNAAYGKNGSKKITDTAASVKDKFLTYTAFIKHESGEMDFVLNIECKDGRYRYWITDFIFTPYARNRYGVYVAEDGVYIPLETAKSKLDKKDVDGYIDQTNAYCTQLSNKLKQFMATGHVPKKAAPMPGKVVTDKW